MVCPFQICLWQVFPLPKKNSKKIIFRELPVCPLRWDKMPVNFALVSPNPTNMASLTYLARESVQTRYERIFEREFYPLMDALYRFALRFTNDPNEADDLVQETYLKALRFMDSYTEGTNARAWLFRICQHAFINDYRSKKSQPYKTDYQDIVVYHNEDDPAAPRYQGFAEEMGGKLLGDEVTLAINNLKPIFRAVLLLDLEGYTDHEIGALLEIELGTVKSRLFRARNTLAEQLRGYAKSQGINVRDTESDLVTPSEDRNMS